MPRISRHLSHQLATEPVVLGDQLAKARHAVVPKRRQGGLTAAFEQRLAQAAFQLANGHGERWLGAMHLAGGGVKPALVNHRQHVAQRGNL
jgi:hypothetical protein